MKWGRGPRGGASLCPGLTWAALAGLEPDRHDYEYERCGVYNIFLACEPLAGKRFVKATKRKTKPDWAQFLRELASHYPDAEKVTLIMDNQNTHKPGSRYEALAPAEAQRLWERFEFVYTPRHGSWLNMAEIELNVSIRHNVSAEEWKP